MKILLGTCFALALAAAVPAMAAPDAYSGQSQQSGQQAGQNGNAGQQDQAPRRHARRAGHQGHVFAQGDRVPHHFLAKRREFTNYARRGLPSPTGGDKWFRARGQFVLVSADGTVKTVVARTPRHGQGQGQGQHRRRMQQQNQDQQDQGQPDMQNQQDQ